MLQANNALLSASGGRCLKDQAKAYSLMIATIHELHEGSWRAWEGNSVRYWAPLVLPASATACDLLQALGSSGHARHNSHVSSLA